MPNRLADALSPYLLQHADNPVDWFEWGEEPFEKARREDKPVFLSIGYATCHWCHVMAHQSFEDEEVAALLNEDFVAIKLDREERPDVDALYMAFCQATTGHGGWPLTVFLTPDQEPFYVGTYFPKRGVGNRPGMMELLPAVARSWAEGREQVLEAASNLVVAVQDAFERQDKPDETLGHDTITAAFNSLATRFDSDHGGFGSAPKFPTPHNLLFLLREHHRRRDALPLRLVRETLTAMRLGGIWDHVGYGFHRYSTDSQWKLPHFEKMLYDQALLAMAYTEAWQAVQQPLFRQTTEEILTYVDRELTSPNGAFYSAEDADSRTPEGEMEEGAFYVWTWEELEQALSSEDVALAIALFNAEREGNFLDEATRQKTGANVLFLSSPLHVAAKRLDMEEEDLMRRVEDIRRRLFVARSTRERPLLDDKVLTDWNGLMIAALSKAAWAFDHPEYSQRAARAAHFILTEMRTEEGRLLHRYRTGTAGLQGLADDYAFFAWGLLELHQATFETRWLTESVRLVDLLVEHFWDEESGSLFSTPNDGERLLLRQRQFYDGATPSANSVAAYAMTRLAHLTGRTDLEERADRILNASADVARYPSGHTMAMMALQSQIFPQKEVVIALPKNNGGGEAMLEVVRGRYRPDTVVHLRKGEDASLVEVAPFVQNQEPRAETATAYVCERFACQEPVSDVEGLRAQLDG